MRRLGAIVVVGLVGGLLAACSSSGLGPDEARLVVNGQAEVTFANGRHQLVRGTRTLHSGDRVRFLSGAGRLDLPNGRGLELRTASDVGVARQPTLFAGEALATAPSSSRPLPLNIGDTVATVGGGAARLSRLDFSVLAASYGGFVDLESAGRTLRVPGLRQADVAAAGLLPDRPVPLDYRPEDPWDERYLGDAIDLGDQLAARSQGLTANVATDSGHTTGFYKLLLPALEPQTFDVDPARSPGEMLVGLAIAVEGRRGSFDDRRRGVFSFRDEGARWGLVALDQAVTRAPLLADIDHALGRATTPFGVAAAAFGGGANGVGGGTPAGTSGGPGGVGGTGGGGNGGGGNGGGGGGGNGGGGGPGTTRPSGPIPPPPTTGTPADGPLQGLVDAINGALGPTTGTTTTITLPVTVPTLPPTTLPLP